MRRYNLISITSVFSVICVVLLPTDQSAHISYGQNSSGSEGVFLRKYRCDFNRSGDTEGWTIPEGLTGIVSGGSLWLAINLPQHYTSNHTSNLYFQLFGDRPHGAHEIISPQGLSVPADQVKKVRFRIMNLSSVKDGLLYWRTKENPDKDADCIRFAIKPDLKEWQEVTVHVDNAWEGTIDQIRLRIPMCWIRGDIWIDWIEITDGIPREPFPRPDVCSDKVVPRISLPGISQEDFQDALKVLDECLIVNVPVSGFNYPVPSPAGGGATYGENWWQVDSSAMASGAKWVNQEFAEGVIRGFIEVQNQNPDGRIDLWGGSAISGQVGELSSLPFYFEAAYGVACRTDDLELRNLIFLSMKKYLEWWLSPVKRDDRTGLITAVFEETLPPEVAAEAISGIGNPSLTFLKALDKDNYKAFAGVDTNVFVAVGCLNTSKLAEKLGKIEDAKLYRTYFDQLKQSINKYMWNEEKGAYYNYRIREERQQPLLSNITFYPLQAVIAPPDRVERLISKLLDPKLFNWGTVPVTTVAKTDPAYVEELGSDCVAASYGDIWSGFNLEITMGLEDVGRHDLAGELAWATIKAFNGNYCEFLVPSTGACGGAKRYGWSGTQYVQEVIEHLFGVNYDFLNGWLRILPRVPEELFGREISLNNLIIPSSGAETRLNVRIHQMAPGKAEIAIELNGKLPPVNLEILLPQPGDKTVRVLNQQGESLPVGHEFDGLSNVVGVWTKMARSIQVRFE